MLAASMAWHGTKKQECGRVAVPQPMICTLSASVCWIEEWQLWRTANNTNSIITRVDGSRVPQPQLRVLAKG